MKQILIVGSDDFIKETLADIRKNDPHRVSTQELPRGKNKLKLPHGELFVNNNLATLVNIDE